MAEEAEILIVEGDAALADTMVLLLERVGYRVLRASQASEGLALARETSPDLLIVDGSFADLLGHLSEDERLRQTPVVVLAEMGEGHTLPRSRGPASDLGEGGEQACPPLHAVIEKPFKPQELLEEVEELLALRASAGEPMAATILVVDDDPDFVQIVARILRANGFRVLAAANGAQAWRQMQEERPDLVLLDIMMSTILDGLGVSQRMREDPVLRDVPVLMVSSIADTDYAAAFPTDQHVHMDAWIGKPVDPDALLKTIRQHL